MRRQNDQTGVNEMTNNLPTNIGDGFDDYDDVSNSIIKGTKVKFTNDAKWLDTVTGEVIQPGREFLIVEIIRVGQKWISGLPAETRVLLPDEGWPNLERLNEEAPRNEWREAFGRKVGPWQRAYVVYMMDPRTYDGFSYPTSTAGGFRAVSELKGATQRARMLRGPNVYPLVTLIDVFMKTQFGGRQRPCFKIEDYVPIHPRGGGSPPPVEKAASPQLEHKRSDQQDAIDRGGHHQVGSKTVPQAEKRTVQTALNAFADDTPESVKKPMLREELNDDINF
jgi:hypothetical protein